MKITVEPLNVLYNGNEAPAYAHLYASQTFTNDDGEVVIGGYSNGANYVKRVTVAYANGVAVLGSFAGNNEIDSTEYAVGGTLATYTLALHSARGKQLAIIYSNLRVPREPTITSWSNIHGYSMAVHQPYRNLYYTAEQVNHLLESFLSTVEDLQGMTVERSTWGMSSGGIVFPVPSDKQLIPLELVIEAQGDIVSATAGHVLTGTSGMFTEDFNWNDFNSDLYRSGGLARIGLAGLEGSSVTDDLVLTNDVPIAHSVKVLAIGILRDL